MARQAGDELHASTETVGHPDPDETTEAGDAVTIDGSGNAVPAGDGDELFGIRSRNRQTRDMASIHHDGAAVAKAEGTVSAGDGLDVGAGAGDGVLETSAGGPAVALSDEGGEYRGSSIPAGHAAVLLR